jgi:O-antigen/teichoic acid export membrane protein
MQWQEIFSKKIVEDFFWISLRYGTASLVALFLSAAFARLTTKEVLGQYYFILSLVAFLSVFSLPGLNTAALRSVTRGGSGAVRQAVKLSFLGSFVAMPILIGYGLHLLQVGQGPFSVGLACLFLGLFYPFLYASNTWPVYYEGKLLFLPVSMRGALSTLAVAALMYGALTMGLDAFGLSCLWFFSNAIFSWFFFWRVSLKESQEKENEIMIDIPYGLGLSLQKFIINLIDNLPIFVVAYWVGYEAVAHYQIAIGFLVAILGFLTLFGSLTLPRIFSPQRSRLRDTLAQHVIVGIMSALGYLFLVEVFFQILYGNEYGESYQIAKALAVLPILLSTRIFCTNVFIAAKKSTALIMGYVTALTLSLSGLLFFLSSLSFKDSIVIYMYAFNVILLGIFAGMYVFLPPMQKSLDKE